MPGGRGGFVASPSNRLARRGSMTCSSGLFRRVRLSHPAGMGGGPAQAFRCRSHTALDTGEEPARTGRRRVGVDFSTGRYCVPCRQRSCCRRSIGSGTSTHRPRCWPDWTRKRTPQRRSRTRGPFAGSSAGVAADGPSRRRARRSTKRYGRKTGAARGEMIGKQPVESQEHGLVRADAQAGSRWYTWVRADRRVARRGSPSAAPGSGPGSRRVVRQSGGTGRGRRRRVGRRTREKVPGLGRWTGPHCSLEDGSGADHERTRTAACRSSFILRRRPRLAAPPSGTRTRAHWSTSRRRQRRIRRRCDRSRRAGPDRGCANRTLTPRTPDGPSLKLK